MAITQKLMELKKNADHDHAKYITTQEFKMLIADNFAINRSKFSKQK